MIIVKEITFSGGACPFQVQGKTDKNEEIYVRYRWGELRIEITRINGKCETVFQKQIGKDQDDEVEIAKMRTAGVDEVRIAKMAEYFKNMRMFSEGEPICFDGYMDMDELRVITEKVIEWPIDEGV